MSASELHQPARPGPVGRALIATIELYRSSISPLRPPTCRYLPSCSAYAVEAVQVHGAARGCWLALRRLLRCHPLHAGGHDPVPPRVGDPDLCVDAETDHLAPAPPARRAA